MNYGNKFLIASIPAIFLAGCGEHELCEKQRSAITRMAIGISEFAKPGGTMYDLQKAQRATEEAKDISQEISARNIKCKKD